jgi:predicted RNase H-like HicB family nuclease
MSELLFNVTQESDGGYIAVAVGESIVTQGDTWDELCHMATDAAKGYFFDSEPPAHIRLFLHIEQALSVS